MSYILGIMSVKQSTYGLEGEFYYYILIVFCYSLIKLFRLSCRIKV